MTSLLVLVSPALIQVERFNNVRLIFKVFCGRAIQPTLGFLDHSLCMLLNVLLGQVKLLGQKLLLSNLGVGYFHAILGGFLLVVLPLRSLAA